jgi:soluble lytic murein transglycosylase-like protein
LEDDVMRTFGTTRRQVRAPLRAGAALLLLMLLVPPPGEAVADRSPLAVPAKAREAFVRPAAALQLERLPYRDEILAASAQTGLDPLLVASVIRVESRFRPHAVSHAGAVGLMQVLPGTGRQYGVHDLADPRENIAAGSRHLAYLIDRYEGDLNLALAAYNAGEATVRRHGGIPPYPETRGYVRKVLAHYRSSAAAPVSLAG